jgi:2-methylcitrate dehydratase PrpD
VQEAAARHLLDGLGCALAALRAPCVENVAPTTLSAHGVPALAVARSLGGPPEAVVPGEAEPLGAAAAAVATGALVHALDFDDTHAGGLVHATAVVLPAAFAVGQQVGATGAEVLRAAVIGYELVCRLGAATPHGFHARGLHATGVCGPPAAAAVTAALLRLDAGSTTAALGIAGSSSGGLLEFLATGSSTKQLHPGSASLAGVLAARLAAAGASGPSSVIEGEHGVLATLSDRPADPASVVEGLGERWETTRIGIKPYPACQLLHSALDAAAALRPGLGAVRSGIAEVHPDADAIVCGPGKAAPRTPYEAKFSLVWSVAAMLIDGAVGIATYDGDPAARTDVAALAGRIETRVVPRPGVAGDAPGRLTLTTVDGRTVTAEVPAAGNASASSVLAKFRGNAGPDCAELAERTLDLARQPSLTAILDLARKACL